MSRFLSPITLVVLAAGLQVVAARWPRRGVRAASCTLGALGLLAMTPLVANLQVAWLEGAVPDAAAGCEGAWTDIVVLSGGFDRPPRDGNDVAALTSESVKRVLAGAALQREHPQARLLVVGGDEPLAESRVAGSLALHYGVPDAALRLEERSGNTRANARAALALLGPQAAPVHLVTGALHMRRAAQAFQAVGLKVCPHPVESQYVAPSGLGSLWPQSTALVKTEAVWHEAVGALLRP